MPVGLFRHGAGVVGERLLGCLWGSREKPLGNLLGQFGGLCLFWGLFWPSWEPLGSPWGPLGASWGLLGAENNFFRFVVPLLGPSWAALGAISGAS